MAAFLNSAVQLATAPAREFGRVTKEQRNPCILLVACVWAVSAVVVTAFAILYWFMAGWYAASGRLGLEGKGSDDGATG